jgi:hypothetical protein
MKTLAQRYADQLPSIPIGKNGRPDPRETSRLKFQLRAEFWHDVGYVLDPHDECTNAGSSAHAFHKRGYRKMSASVMQASVGAMRQYLAVERLRFNTWFKLRPIFGEFLQKAMTHDDVDIALCALVEFVRLELGEAPDPEYGNFPQREDPWSELRDENLSDNEMEAQAQLERYEDFGTSEYHMLKWFRGWEKVINDPSEFEEAYPGMGHRRQNLAQAMRPIFSYLDPILDVHVLELCLDWTKPLMKGLFEENRFPIAGRAPLQETQGSSETSNRLLELT